MKIQYLPNAILLSLCLYSANVQAAAPSARISSDHASNNEIKDAYQRDQEAYRAICEKYKKEENRSKALGEYIEFHKELFYPSNGQKSHPRTRKPKHACSLSS
jgi:hypothetical protein